MCGATRTNKKMKTPKVILAALLTMAFATAPLALAKPAGKGTWIVPACSTPKKATQNVLFGYRKPVEGGPSGGILYPICLINGKKITDVPYSGSEERKSFESDFMHKGAQYNLFCAGKALGKINSKELINSDYESYLACSLNKAAAKSNGLATNMSIASQAKSLPMNVAERSKLKALAISTLKSAKVPNALLKDLKFTDLEKIQSGKNASPLLVANAQVDEPTGNSPITHSVFLVVSDLQSGMQKQICNVYHSTGDLGEGNQGIETYFGQLDIDGDGIAEIVSQHDFAGSSAFRIYSKQKNKKWKNLGTFGSYGPGC